MKDEKYYLEKAGKILRKIRIEGKEITEEDTKELLDCIRCSKLHTSWEGYISLGTKNKIYILKILLFHGSLLEPIKAAQEIRNMRLTGYIKDKEIFNIYNGEKKYNTTDFCPGVLLQEIMRERSET
jgi:hypothetical protein